MFSRYPRYGARLLSCKRLMSQDVSVDGMSNKYHWLSLYSIERRWRA